MSVRMKGSSSRGSYCMMHSWLGYIFIVVICVVQQPRSNLWDLTGYSGREAIEALFTGASSTACVPASRLHNCTVGSSQIFPMQWKAEHQQ